MEVSGPLWCQRFPTSVLVEDLVEPFRDGVAAMRDALIAGGAEISIAATYRPAERAYLMHYACMIAMSGQDPAEVPCIAGCDIDWTHGGDLASARAAAGQMIRTYGIAFPAALVSRHTQRRAIDWRITLPVRPNALPEYKDAHGKIWHLQPNDLPALYAFGATFGVIKLIKDAPHWSDDGQ